MELMIWIIYFRCNGTIRDDYPIWKTSISSFFYDNINEEKYWKAKDKEYD